MTKIVIFSGLLLVFALHLLIRAETNLNNIIFERFECHEPNPEFLSELKCEMKTIARNVITVNLTMVLKKELKNNIWLRTGANYRYNTYVKVIEVSENICGYFNGTDNAPIFKRLVDNLIRFKTQFHFKLQCPLPGTIMFTNAGLNVSQFILPLLPSGRYRFDLAFRSGRNGPTMVSTQIYVSVSDIRAYKWR